MTIEHAVGRMFCVGFGGTSFTPELRDLLRRGVSSVILFSRNYESPSQLAELCLQIKSHVSRPILICVDQEGGRVQRFRDPFASIPSMRELGQQNDPAQVTRVGRVMARSLRAVNIDMNLAPVLDVDSNPDNPVIGERSFSSDPAVVARLGCTLIDALQSAGMAACGKHFPGHGDTSVDSHFDLPRLQHAMDRLQEIELLPFQHAIKTRVAAIMCAHVILDALDPEHPATMSRAVICDLLRQKMKFDGVVCSDDLEMHAITKHFGVEEAVLRGAHAGIDLFLVCKDHGMQHQAIDAVISGISKGDVLRGRVMEANHRLDVLFDRFVRPGSRWSERSMELLGQGCAAPSRSTSS